MYELIEKLENTLVKIGLSGEMDLGKLFLGNFHEFFGKENTHIIYSSFENI